MPSRLLVERYRTNKTPEQIREALILSFRSFGGAVQYTREGFIIVQGIQGLSNNSTANLSSQCILRKIEEGLYEVGCTIAWSMNGWTIACIFLGFPFVFPWIFPILYFFFDPTSAYQQALYRVQYILDPQPALK